MAHDLVCWKCGASLAEMSLPLMRLDVCPKCRAELHVCKLCVDYDTRVAKHCREPIAEEVKDKTRANFCDFYKPRAGAYTAPDTAEVNKSLCELEKLFGKK
jgi:Zn-finger nucleic acid-binding protein